MGVAGAELGGQSILITGLAGLLAGSLSMALGEWLSVQSARELFEHQIGIEREELLAAPEEEAEELALIYQAKGLDRRSGARAGTAARAGSAGGAWIPWRARNWVSTRPSWAARPGWRRSRRSSSLRWERRVVASTELEDGVRETYLRRYEFQISGGTRPAARGEARPCSGALGVGKTSLVTLGSPMTRSSLFRIDRRDSGDATSPAGRVWQ